jgi:hypothetical protein
MLCIFVPGCATIKYRLDPATAAQVDTAKARTQVAQEHVSIKILASSYGGGGLLGAAINAGVESSRRKDADRRVQPLLKAVENLDHRAKVWEKLVPALQSAEWPKVVDVKTAPDLMPVTAEDVRDSAFVSLSTSYSLSPNASVLEMHTSYHFYMRGSTSPAAIGGLSYWSKQIGKTPDGKKWTEDEDAIALWVANDGAAYRAAVDEGIAETVKMLRIALPFVGGKDLAGTGESVEIKYNVTHGRGDFGISEGQSKFQGRVLERNAERLVFQAYGGPIYSVPAAEIQERRLP